MTTLRELIKDRRLYSVDANRTVLEAARYMLEHNVGALPVLRDGNLAGILSERDIMNRVVAVGRTPGTTAVSEVMTANPRAVPADESIEECLFIMREFGFRHLPIVEGPNDVHVVGRNASSTKPAKFLVFLVKNKGAPVLVPAK